MERRHAVDRARHRNPVAPFVLLMADAELRRLLRAFRHGQQKTRVIVEHGHDVFVEIRPADDDTRSLAGLEVDAIQKWQPASIAHAPAPVTNNVVPR